MIPNAGFSEEQQQYLSGFVAGVDASRTSQGLPTFARTLGLPADGARPATGETPLPGGPEAIHEQARRATEAAGGKLCPEELAKRAKNALDIWDELVAHARDERYPKGTDVLLFKFHGLFYVAPAQNAFMSRLRFAGGLINAHQLRGVAALAEQYAGGYADITTRANLQLREIPASGGVPLLLGLQDLGIVNRGSGADNVRNITAPCTAGIDAAELYDVLPLCREMQYYLLYHREFFGLPRKFNIAFDGGGITSALEDTNDIGFVATRVGEGKSVPTGVYFRVQLGGITGHLDFARDTGLLLTAAECVPVAGAMLRVFAKHGDRTDRKKARLKYLLDKWGFEKFLAETEAELGRALPRLPLADCEPRGPVAKHAHVGRFTQKQTNKRALGVVLPVGRILPNQMRGLAEIAERYGSGTLRLTVWQNVLIPDIDADKVAAVEARIGELGLTTTAGGLRAGLIACTGNAGCKYAAANTKKHALELVDALEERLSIELPINIHLTGCHHSCAQHYIGDIGCLATKVAVGDEMVEGYHVYVGGGYLHEQGIGREMFRNVPADELADACEGILRAWLTGRESPTESFHSFLRRTPTDELQSLAGYRTTVTA